VGDILTIPVSVNNMYTSSQKVTLSTVFNSDYFKVSNAEEELSVGGRSRLTHNLYVEALAATDSTYITVDAGTKSKNSDSITQFSMIRARGFP
jgi:hypothetical protein